MGFDIIEINLVWHLISHSYFTLICNFTFGFTIIDYLCIRFDIQLHIWILFYFDMQFTFGFTFVYAITHSIWHSVPISLWYVISNRISHLLPHARNVTLRGNSTFNFEYQISRYNIPFYYTFDPIQLWYAISYSFSHSFLQLHIKFDIQLNIQFQFHFGM